MSLRACFSARSRSRLLSASNCCLPYSLIDCWLQVLDRFALERVLDLEDADGFCLCVLNVVEAGFDVVFLDEPFG